MRPATKFGWIVLAALLLVPLAAAQSSPAHLLLVHAMPGAADAALVVDGTVRTSAAAGGTSDGYVSVDAGTPTIEAELDGVRAAAAARELRGGFRYVAVLFRSDAGEPALEVFTGPVGRIGGDALVRTVNLVPALSEVRTFLLESCGGSHREVAASFGDAAPYGWWEYNHSGPLTVCAGDAPLAPTRERPTDPAEPWLLSGRVLAIYVVAGLEGTEVLFVDETP